jgi:aromatic ring-cleaving dioxygenase
MTRSSAETSPYHAHIYYSAAERPIAVALRDRLLASQSGGSLSELRFIGKLRDHRVGPHLTSQFEIHFEKWMLQIVEPELVGSGLRVLIHPLTLDDVGDHTYLGQWIGEPVDLDLTVLDPPGVNQGFARFGKTDF